MNTEDLLLKLTTEGGLAFEEAVAWGIYSNTLGLKIGVGLLVVAVALFLLAYVSCRKCWSDEVFLASVVFGLLFTVTASLFLWTSYVGLKKWEKAPRVAFLEEVRR